MSQRHAIEITYRGQRYSGEWYVEGAEVHVICAHGSKSGPAAVPSRVVSLPSELAAEIFWQLMRENDPKRPLFYWR